MPKTVKQIKIEDNALSRLRKLWLLNRDVLVFAFRTRSLFFIIIPIIFVITFIDYFGGDLHLNALINIWTELIDPIIGITTLIIAFSVWHGELIQDWKNSIPKKLTVIFLYQGKEILRCNRADLASEADIRPLGQQIGSQMIGGGQLRLIAPLVRQHTGNVLFDHDISFFRNYEVTFELIELPPHVKDNTCLVWDPPFSQPAKTILLSD